MLFNSYIFIFVFLPVTLIAYFSIGRLGSHRIAVVWLVFSSLFFYGWWNPSYLGLLLFSIFFNYTFGVLLSGNAGNTTLSRKAILGLGIAVNLGLLGYFKYFNFFIDNLNSLLAMDYHVGTIILPLAISFFSFQQIAYLVDAYEGLTREYNFLHYCLFVTFFPQLIAGPIVHHKEMLPQFSLHSMARFSQSDLAVGVTIFAIGLFKKVVIADNIAVYATPVFASASGGVEPTFIEAWTGSLAYTLQLYFDFSGYSDMAIGLARLFGVRLPENFNSPYKADNIIDFWRRWHITLSRFLRDYLYIPLGGNRKGKLRRYNNLLLTMLLGGLWHGAGWTFVIWGALHGLYLVTAHGWHAIKRRLFGTGRNFGLFGRLSARSTTFLAVVVGWVFFRADSVNTALSILAGMIGMNGFALPAASLESLPWLRDALAGAGWLFSDASTRLFFGTTSLLLCMLLLLIAWFAPNTQQIMRLYKPVIGSIEDVGKGFSAVVWRPTLLNATLTALLAATAILSLQRASEFLYFQF